MRPEVIAYVAVGSNLGDRAAHLAVARARLGGTAGVRALRASPVYESVAIGPGDQAEYLNGVYELSTTLAAHELLGLLQAVENEAGRQRTERWGPRTLDLDLLLHGSTCLEDPSLCLPHPRLRERNFVVFPLHDLAPDLRLPDGTALSELRVALGSQGLQPAAIRAPCHA